MAIEVASAFDEIVFTFGFCEGCQRNVLTHPDFAADGEQMLCVHCDAVVSRDLAAAAGAELPDHGYGLLELQGCGNPECGGGACSRLRDGEAAD